MAEADNATAPPVDPVSPYNVRATGGSIRLMSQEEVGEMVRSSIQRAKQSPRKAEMSPMYSTAASRRLSRKVAPRPSPGVNALSPTGRRYSKFFGQDNAEDGARSKKEGSMFVQRPGSPGKLFRSFQPSPRRSLNSSGEHRGEASSPRESADDRTRGTTADERFAAMVSRSPRKTPTSIPKPAPTPLLSNLSKTTTTTHGSYADVTSKKTNTEISETELSSLVRNSIKRARDNANPISQPLLSPNMLGERKFSWSSLEEDDRGTNSMSSSIVTDGRYGMMDEDKYSVCESKLDDDNEYGNEMVGTEERQDTESVSKTRKTVINEVKSSSIQQICNKKVVKVKRRVVSAVPKEQLLASEALVYRNGSVDDLSIECTLVTDGNKAAHEYRSFLLNLSNELRDTLSLASTAKTKKGYDNGDACSIATTIDNDTIAEEKNARKAKKDLVHMVPIATLSQAKISSSSGNNNKEVPTSHDEPLEVVKTVSMEQQDGMTNRNSSSVTEKTSSKTVLSQRRSSSSSAKATTKDGTSEAATPPKSLMSTSQSTLSLQNKIDNNSKDYCTSLQSEEKAGASEENDDDDESTSNTELLQPDTSNPQHDDSNDDESTGYLQTQSDKTVPQHKEEENDVNDEVTNGLVASATNPQHDEEDDANSNAESISNDEENINSEGTIAISQQPTESSLSQNNTTIKNYLTSEKIQSMKDLLLMSSEISPDVTECASLQDNLPTNPTPIDETQPDCMSDFCIRNTPGSLSSKIISKILLSSYDIPSRSASRTMTKTQTNELNDDDDDRNDDRNNDTNNGGELVEMNASTKEIERVETDGEDSDTTDVEIEIVEEEKQEAEMLDSSAEIDVEQMELENVKETEVEPEVAEDPAVEQNECVVTQIQESELEENKKLKVETNLEETEETTMQEDDDVESVFSEEAPSVSDRIQKMLSGSANTSYTGRSGDQSEYSCSDSEASSSNYNSRHRSRSHSRSCRRTRDDEKKIDANDLLAQIESRKGATITARELKAMIAASAPHLTESLLERSHDDEEDDEDETFFDDDDSIPSVIQPGEIGSTVRTGRRGRKSVPFCLDFLDLFARMPDVDEEDEMDMDDDDVGDFTVRSTMKSSSFSKSDSFSKSGRMSESTSDEGAADRRHDKERINEDFENGAEADLDTYDGTGTDCDGTVTDYDGTGTDYDGTGTDADDRNFHDGTFETAPTLDTKTRRRVTFSFSDGRYTDDGDDDTSDSDDDSGQEESTLESTVA